MAQDILPVLISLSNCLTSSFTSFFCFGCLIWRAFASVKNSSSRPCFHKITRWIRVLELDPFVSDLVLGNLNFYVARADQSRVVVWHP